MNNKKHTFGGIAGKGYYIALILCAAAIGISGYLYYRNANANRNARLETPVLSTEGPAQVEAVATRPVPLPEQETAAPTQPPVLKTGMPVAGETVSGYAMDCLSYNETTRDWRAHDGLDISAAPGTPVLAAAGGTVYTVYEDDTMGTTVVIRHRDGYATRYASLDPQVTVAPGDTVRLGQPIGTVGTSALLETVLGPHVHFAVTCGGKPADPAEFLHLE